MTGTVTILVGVALQDREEQFFTLLALSVLLPAFLQEGGALGGILSSRLSSKIHLGLLAPRAEEPLAPAPADRAFGELWNRTDLAVARAQTGRSWMWGPQSFATGSEAYREAPGGRRTVQYWDKSRMEVNNPGADRGQLWFVTNGLLARELISGKMQV